MEVRKIWIFLGTSLFSAINQCQEFSQDKLIYNLIYKIN